MKDEKLNEMLGSFDYSELSNVKDSLLANLLQKRREDRERSAAPLGIVARLQQRRVARSVMAEVAAAGTGVPKDTLRQQLTETPEKK